MIQGVSEDLGFDIPSVVIASPDSQTKQLLQIAQREGRDLASRYQWSAMIRENVFTLTDGADQGALNSTVVSDGDFDYIVNDAMWDRTTSLPIPGALTPQKWQVLQTFATGPFFQYRIQGGNLFMDPAPSSQSDTIAFEYMSNAWCQSTGGTKQSSWQADSDTGILDENLMGLGITWRFLQRKGAEYAQDFQDYERRVALAMARDGGKARLRAGGPIRTGPGVFVPPASWPL